MRKTDQSTRLVRGGPGRRPWLLLGLGMNLFLAADGRTDTLMEAFDRDPAMAGWQSRGDASLFAWDPMGKRLAVTWDSARTNSFFHRPLGTILTRRDDFRLSFALVLKELETGSGGGSFQLAIGLLQRESAFQTNFFRGAGVNPAWGPRNLVEFDYFPGGGAITPTFSAVAVGTNNLRWAMVNLFPAELTLGDRFEVTLEFRSRDQRLSLTVARQGEPYVAGSTVVGAGLGDFRADTFSITSYSGDHQPAGYGGQILARGWVDDIEVAFPDPPIPRLDVRLTSQGLDLVTPVVPDWQPRMERSTSPGDWERADLEWVTGDATWTFRDPAPALPLALYRLVLDRP